MTSLNSSVDIASIMDDVIITPKPANKSKIKVRSMKDAKGNGARKQLNIRFDNELVKDYADTCRSLNVCQHVPLEKMLRRFIKKHKKASI